MPANREYSEVLLSSTFWLGIFLAEGAYYMFKGRTTLHM